MIDNNYTKLVHKELKNINSEAVYISKPENFETEYDLLINSFRKHYDNVNIAYSFKTNYIPDFLNIVKNKKGYAEVVSIMELELALKVGFLPKNIFFNGPFKHKKETQEFLSLGVLVNLDSYDEFKWIEKFANESKIICRIGIRLNFNLPENPSRFGISKNDKSIQEIITKSNSNKYLSFESLHYHYAPRKLSMWKTCAKEFVSFLDNLDLVVISKLKFISLGGGMFSRMDNYIQKQLPFDIPSFDEYANNSVKYLVDYFNSKQDLSFTPEILIEPGTALASKALDFAVQVVSVKNINDEFYINTSGSKYNMNPSPNRINSPTEVYNSNTNNTIYVKKAKLSGYTCIESDIIHDDFSGDIAKGDTIIFKEVGAYSVVMKPPFILPDVAIIQFNKNTNCYDLIRCKQTFNDVFHNFKFLKND
jgi:diaminopimelate decarboxylase